MLSVFDRDLCLRYKWHYWALWVPQLGQMHLSVWGSKERQIDLKQVGQRIKLHFSGG